METIAYLMCIKYSGWLLMMKIFIGNSPGYINIDTSAVVIPRNIHLTDIVIIAMVTLIMARDIITIVQISTVLMIVAIPLYTNIIGTRTVVVIPMMAPRRIPFLICSMHSASSRHGKGVSGK